MTSFVRLPPLEVHRLADGALEAELRSEGGISTMEASWWVRKASPQKAVGVGQKVLLLLESRRLVTM